MIIASVLILLTVVSNITIHILGLPADEYEDLMITIYGSGAFVETLKQRLSDYYEWFYWGIFQTENIVYTLDYGVYYLELFAFLTLGLAVGKCSEYFNKLQSHVGSVLKLSLFSFVGIVCLEIGKTIPIEWLEILSPIEKLLFGTLYVCGFCILYLKMGGRLRHSFASVGRMTLTWYLFFSLLMSFILHGYGLGFYGKIGPSMTSGIGIVYLGVCFVVSSFWLEKFGQGPIEKIWRALSYPK